MHTYLRLIISIQDSDDSYSICSVCNGIFIDVEDYTDHTCKPIEDESKIKHVLPDKKRIKREKEESDGK